LDIIFKVLKIIIIIIKKYHKKVLTHLKRKERKKGRIIPLYPPKGISIALKTTNLFKLKNK